MIEFVNMFISVINFIGNKIMTINIGGITVLGWLTAIILIIIVISFIYKNADGFVVKSEKRRNKEKDE